MDSTQLSAWSKQWGYGIFSEWYKKRYHMYVIGKTGMGKTTLLLNMILNDIRNGEGISFIDPHGDAAEKLLGYIPSQRGKDVIYFNPADVDALFGDQTTLNSYPVFRNFIIIQKLFSLSNSCSNTFWTDSYGNVS